MRLDSIVIGMDFSQPAIKSAKWVSEHFAPDAQLTLVHVIDPPDRPHFAAHLLPSPETVEAAARDYADTQMGHMTAFLAEASPTVDIRVGKPYEEIVKAAREHQADLVAIGPHGDRPHRSTFLGTTAERVIRTSTAPVLVVTEPPAGRPCNLLVPVDDVAITPVQIATARDLAEQFDADVTLLQVWSNSVYSHVASMAYATAASEASARQEIDNDLRAAAAQWLEELGHTGINRDRVSALVTYGSAGEAIVAVAAAHHIDLIIMGRSGSGLVAPALLGSTVSTVLHEARCPVLVVTGQPEHAAAAHGRGSA